MKFDPLTETVEKFHILLPNLDEPEPKRLDK
jgi:hypothetical protein